MWSQRPLPRFIASNVGISREYLVATQCIFVNGSFATNLWRSHLSCLFPHLSSLNLGPLEILNASSGIFGEHNAITSYNKRINWRIDGKHGSQIRLIITDYRFEFHVNCSFDYLEVCFSHIQNTVD